MERLAPKVTEVKVLLCLRELVLPGIVFRSTVWANSEVALEEFVFDKVFGAILALLVATLYCQNYLQWLVSRRSDLLLPRKRSDVLCKLIALVEKFGGGSLQTTCL